MGESEITTESSPQIPYSALKKAKDFAPGTNEAEFKKQPWMEDVRTYYKKLVTSN